MVTAIIDSSSSDKLDEILSADAVSASTNSLNRVVVCRVDRGRVSAVLGSKNRQGISGDRIDFGESPSRSKNASRKNRRKTPCVLWLPKSLYLNRVLKLPVAPEVELRAMIRLEIEASLPADYGPVEVGYRSLSESSRYEVYAVKRATLEAVLQILEDSGLRPSTVLPSALFYLAPLSDTDRAANLLGTHIEDALAEVSFLNRDGSLSVRTLAATHTPELLSGLTQVIRSMSSERPRPRNPHNPRNHESAFGDDVQDNVGVTLGWVGEPPAEDSWLESLSIRSRNSDLCLLSQSDDQFIDKDVSLGFAVRAILEGRTNQKEWPTLNLLPASHAEAWGRHRLYRQLGVGVAGFLMAIVFVYLALTLSTSRYQTEIARLDAEIARISTTGEAVGERLDQLEAVADARRTRDDFGVVVAALHDASPSQGLSYSQVDLNAESRLQLRGQAESLAMPFELPEQLELQPWFEGVMLRDAGQAKKGVGSITEFRVDAKLVRAHPDAVQARGGEP